MSRKIKRLKLYKRYEEDLWGFLAKLNKPKYNKALIYLYYCFLGNYKYKRILQSKRLFSVKKRFVYRLAVGDVEFKNKKRNFKASNNFSFLKVKWFYGNLKRTQIKKLLLKYKNNTRLYGSFILYFLESRLSTVLYRLNLFDSFFSIQQFIKHGNVYVNNKQVKHCSYNLKLYDIVLIKSNHRLKLYNKLKIDLERNIIIQNYPLYIESNYKSMSFTMYKLPSLKEVRYPFEVNIDNIINNI